MDKMEEAIKLAMEQFKAEHGEDARLEDGEEFATVFNDAVVIIGVEDKTFRTNILAGKPYFVDLSLFLPEDYKTNN